MKKNIVVVLFFCFVYNYTYTQQITIKQIESRLVTYQGVEFIGELKDTSNDLYLFSDWDNKGILYLNNKNYRISNINFNVNSNSFDSRIDRKRLFLYKNSTIDSVEINNRLFKKVDEAFYEVLFEKGDNAFLKKHDIKVHKGSINRLDLSEGESFTSLDYKYLIKTGNIFKRIELNKKSIIGLLENKKDQDLLLEFVNEQNLSYKKEKDFIEIFEYILKNTEMIVQ